MLGSVETCHNGSRCQAVIRARERERVACVRTRGVGARAVYAAHAVRWTVHSRGGVWGWVERFGGGVWSGVVWRMAVYSLSLSVCLSLSSLSLSLSLSFFLSPSLFIYIYVCVHVLLYNSHDVQHVYYTCPLLYTVSPKAWGGASTLGYDTRTEDRDGRKKNEAGGDSERRPGRQSARGGRATVETEHQKTTRIPEEMSHTHTSLAHRWGFLPRTLTSPFGGTCGKWETEGDVQTRETITTASMPQHSSHAEVWKAM